MFSKESSNSEENIEFLPLITVDEDISSSNDYGNELPIIPLRNTVMFPSIVVPISIGREQSLKAIKEANQKNKFVGILAQKKVSVEDPTPNDLYHIGVIGRIVKLFRMPDGSTTAILHGHALFKTLEYLPDKPYLCSTIETLPYPVPKDLKFFKAIVAAIRDVATQIIGLSNNISPESSIVLRNIENPLYVLYFICSQVNFSQAEKQKLLEMTNLKQMTTLILEYLQAEWQVLELKSQIQAKTKIDMDKQQRDYFLHQQLKTIQDELGNENPLQDIDELNERAKKKKWPKHVKDTFEKELGRLQRTNPMMPDHSLLLNYLELLLDLPWLDYSNDSFDLHRAQKVLDKDHYGLEKIKNRILEYLAVLKLKGDLKSPILCFVGPPGVGKTSLGKSIAHALNRKYVRMSLGGLHDESEIRGHRRTYIGAMPGRIIQSIKKAKCANPVFILDEIDKVGSDFRGDPASALLEVLDPEQNNTFYDNFLELDFDLSKVMFIATANSLTNIHPALLDRMEIIRLSGYSPEEKAQIAKTYLIPKQRELHGLAAKQAVLNDKTIAKIIDDYTREAGVRVLEQRIAALMRARAKAVALDEAYNSRFNQDDVTRILGAPIFDKDIYMNDNPPGVAIGLAWTETGGDILFIETILSQGKGNLALTGNLGDVMKESATTAMSYIRAHSALLGIAADTFDNTNIHIHIPEGAIPKDGPSAGITLLTALTSVLTQKQVKPYTAMTGEITLRGKVLPVGGIKEKILAAKRAGMREIILCAANKKDIEEIKPEYIKDLQFHYVKDMHEVLRLALG